MPVDKSGNKLSDTLSSPVVTRYLIDVQQHSVGKEAEALEREKERLQVRIGITRKGPMRAVVTKRNVLDMQVCVPEYWIDEQAVLFANTENPCGTEDGWMIRRDGDEALAGDPERQPCQQRSGHVHIILDALKRPDILDALKRPDIR